MKNNSFFLKIVPLFTALILLLSACGQKDGQKREETTETEHVHSWAEATPYEPKTCTVCGATEGSVLAPEFEKYGIECSLEVGKSYEYKTHCSADKTVETKGTLTVKSYEIFDSDKTRPQKDGYEWRVVKAEISFRELNAYEKGFLYAFAGEDYYGIINRDRTYNQISDSDGTYTIRLDGEDKTVTERLTESFSGWNDFGVNTVRVEYSVQVPKGYDGAVIGFLDPTKREVGQMIFEADLSDALFFRLK